MELGVVKDSTSESRTDRLSVTRSRAWSHRFVHRFPMMHLSLDPDRWLIVLYGWSCAGTNYIVRGDSPCLKRWSQVRLQVGGAGLEGSLLVAGIDLKTLVRFDLATR